MEEATVEVQLAFVFECPKCHADTFVRSVVHEFSEEEKSDLSSEIGENPQTGNWVTHPESVACRSCGSQYRAINPGELVEKEG